jgi:hypothetical protein
MNLADKIKAIYPELEDKDFVNGNIEVWDILDGNGPFLKEWNHPTLAEPTQEQLDAITE